MCYQKINSFIEQCNPYQSGLLGEIEKFALKNNIPIISKEVSGFLSLILNLKRPKKILELGSAIAYSSILMSQFLSKDGFIVTIERSEKMIRLAKNNIAKSKLSCIKLIEDDIENVLPNLKDSFDIIFFDAAKGQYINILPLCLDLLNNDGIIIADDILQDGRTVKNRYEIPRRQRTIHSRMNKFIHEIFNTPCLKSNIFKIGDGVIVAQKIKP
jgi:Predicted O-methyltransferase